MVLTRDVAIEAPLPSGDGLQQPWVGTRRHAVHFIIAAPDGQHDRVKITMAHSGSENSNSWKSDNDDYKELVDIGS